MRFDSDMTQTSEKKMAGKASAVGQCLHFFTVCIVRYRVNEWRYFGKIYPNSGINDSPGAITPLSTKGGMNISSPHKEGKEQTGIINLYQSRWYFLRVSTDFLQ